MKTIDGMFGLAIGDALGVPAEFQSRLSLKNKPITDMTGYGTHNQPPGTWSDDTSMAIAAMDSMIECGGIDYDDIMTKFVEWMNTSKYTAGGVFFDIGITTRNALYTFESGQTPAVDCGEPYENANGNGSLMRILPFVLFCAYKKFPFEKEVEIINNASSLTHRHEISKLGCKIYSDVIKEILDGHSLVEALHNLKEYDYTKYYKQESIAYYQRVLDGSIIKAAENQIQSTGFVVHTLEAALWCNLTSQSYQDAVLKAVNLGDDTDTVGAVTGSIAGMIYGYELIPETWRDTLVSKDYLMELCTKFDQIFA